MRPILPLLALAASLSAATGGDDYPQPVVADRRPMLGVQMTPPPGSVAEREGLGPNQGVYVQDVFPGTAASAMGIKPGDVIVAVNGSQVESMTGLRNEVGMGNVGDPVDVVVARGGRQLALNDQLREWPSNVPYEPIDPAAERRFRDWQQRRYQGQQAQLDQLRQDLAQAARQMGVDPAKLAPTAPGRAAPQTLAEAPASAALAAIPAWTLRLDIDSARQTPRPVQLPSQAEAGEAVSLDLPGGAWRFAWNLSSL